MPLAEKGSQESEPREAEWTRHVCRLRLVEHVTIAPGFALGPYEIVCHLGAGGMGEVYRARDSRLGREVAVKVLPCDRAADADLVRRFEQEARAIASLSHPNICTLFDVGEAAGLHYLVMELLAGETLAARLAGGRLDPALALRTAREVAAALAAAHRRGIVHRDLKPGNVMLVETGAKLLDFGLAKTWRGERGALENAKTEVETSPGIVVGTLAYMSPEQLKGRTADERSDVFSFGVMLYEMVAGRRPFSGSTAPQLAAALLRDEPAQLPAGVALPDELQAVILRCLRRDPAERFASAAPLAEALAAVAAGAPAATAPAPALPPKQGDAAPAVPGGRRSVLVFEFANLARDPVADWLSTGIAETVTVDLKKLSGLAVAGRERVAPELAGRQGGALTQSEQLQLGGAAGVDLVVSGSFQKVGDALRLTATVLEVAGGAVAASVKVDGSMSELFAMQDRLVATLLDDLGVVVADSRRERRDAVAAPRLDAYELYARGRQLHNRLGRAGLEEARACYEKAVAADPGYALAYSGLGGVSMMRYIATTNRSDLDVGIVYLQRAAALDPELADPHLWLTYGLARLGRYAEAHSEGGQAIVLEAENPLAHYFAGVAYWLEGMEVPTPGCWRRAGAFLSASAKLAPRYQAAWQGLGDVRLRLGEYASARAALERAGAIERSGQHTLVRFVGAYSVLGRVLQRAEGSDAALAAYGTSLELLEGMDHVYVPSAMALARVGEGEAHLRAGRCDEALRSYRQANDLCRGFQRSLGMGWMAVRAAIGMATAFRALGMRREEDAAAAEARFLGGKPGPLDFSAIWDGGTAVVSHEWARYHALSSRHGEAIEALRQAVAAGWCDASWLTRDELLEELRSDPTFAILVATAAEGARANDHDDLVAGSGALAEPGR
jgi:serine/threonine protein kinase/tetratricopeptide (TPR) repeat protein